MQITHQLTEQQIQQLHQLYQNEYWSKGRSLEDTFRCVQGSSIIFGFVEGENLQAFARVVTDYVFKAFIFDVIVSEQLRARGVGKQIVESILNHPELKKVKHIELYCLPELFSFYSQFGFTQDIASMQLMRRDRDLLT
jgi:predicted GNAT family N-acyltransferase